jgi:hypothetical protein
MKQQLLSMGIHSTWQAKPNGMECCRILILFPLHLFLAYLLLILCSSSPYLNLPCPFMLKLTPNFDISTFLIHILKGLLNQTIESKANKYFQINVWATYSIQINELCFRLEVTLPRMGKSLIYNIFSL